MSSSNTQHTKQPSQKHVNFHKSSSTISAHANLHDLINAQKALSENNINPKPFKPIRRPDPLSQKSSSDGLVLEGKIISIGTTTTSRSNDDSHGLSPSNPKHMRSHSYDPNIFFSNNDERATVAAAAAAAAAAGGGGGGGHHMIHTPTSSPTTSNHKSNASHNIHNSSKTNGHSTESPPYYHKSNRIHPSFFLSSLGDVYSNTNAFKAYMNDKLCSESMDERTKLRILFVNQTSKPLILCWVGFDHKLHHYYKIEPSCTTTITGGLDGIRAKSLLNTQFEGGMHLEHTRLGHSFIIGTCPTHQEKDYNDDDDDNDEKDDAYFSDDDDDDDEEDSGRVKKWCWIPFGKRSKKRIVIDTSNDWDKSKLDKIIAAYRPMQLSLKMDEESNLNDSCVHMVTITEELSFISKSSVPKLKYHLAVTFCQIDDTPLDTSDKVYGKNNWAGWTVCCEEGLFSSIDDNEYSQNRSISHSHSSSSTRSLDIKDLANTSHDANDILLQKVRQKFHMDLVAASKKIPKDACEYLKKSTPFWINRSQRYGPKALPVRGKGMCFHPEKSWLKRNGMSEDKCGGIELYEADKYLDDCDLWYGRGGVLIHELAHAL
jgi:hypothetical protein